MSEPLWDLETLRRVHDVFEFDCPTTKEFDNWLHEQIQRSRLGRDLSSEEASQLLGEEHLGGGVGSAS